MKTTYTDYGKTYTYSNGNISFRDKANHEFARYTAYNRTIRYK